MPAVMIVGAGPMGRWHQRAARNQGARIVAVADRDGSAATALAARTGQTTAAGTDAVALARATGTAIAHVCTPVETHHALVSALLDSGVNVLVEKPFAATAAEVDDCLDRAAHAGRLVCPVHQYAFQRGVEQALAMLPKQGAVDRIAFEICTAGATGRFVDRDDAMIAEILPHPLSLLQRLLPDVDVATLDWQVGRASPGNAAIAARAGRVLIDVWISTTARPTRFVTTIHARGGTIEIDGFHGHALGSRGVASRAVKLAGPFLHGGKQIGLAAANLASRALRREVAYPGLRALVGRFYAAVDGSAPPPITPAQMRAVARAAEDIVARLRRKTP